MAGGGEDKDIVMSPPQKKDDIVVLMDDAQLMRLAILLRNKEEAIGRQMKFKSPEHLAEYLDCVNGAYDHAVSLLRDSSHATSDAHRAAADDDDTRRVIADDLSDYIKWGLNYGMQNIRNCSHRLDCISKIRAHYDSVVAELSGRSLGERRLRELAEEMVAFKESMSQHCKNLRSGSSRALSKLYSMALKQENVKFPDLVNKHKKKLGFHGEFSELEEAEKLEVYNSIIDESGRAKVQKRKAIVERSKGVAVLVATAGLIVWDIYTAEHTLEATVHRTLNVLSDVGQFAVQVAVEAAVTDMLVDVELGVFVVSLAGFVVGTAAGFLFAAVSGLFMDAIFGSGGTAPPPVENVTFHKVITPPDGMALANRIYYDG
uniref:Uncharacterized protein n=1 Tax=Leersia perrieri TaxID=77586 RepID=A0A0D9W3D4_9ORYZ